MQTLARILQALRYSPEQDARVSARMQEVRDEYNAMLKRSAS
jgi:hypothetical protein